jgi:hypothetical protein
MDNILPDAPIVAQVYYCVNTAGQGGRRQIRGVGLAPAELQTQLIHGVCKAPPDGQFGEATAAGQM